METIKEEKKADLEQLLNSLIEKGWKPFGTKYDLFVWNTNSSKWGFRGQYAMTNGDNAYDYFYEYFYPRQIVSKESGLWQFVCENKLQPTNRSGSWEYSDGYTGWTCMAYQFRLIESSLKDESELEDFLLQNIKLD